ncbi:kelch-like protein diablo isoform X2 [Macrosteles quadrilineatus]|nr:kelch-like protein diablo isoform X2 [Macrosteles quadrilineatus]XP_054286792.1 kelch-like protein diablo isoform X2 [Macrosteles quadrilineatus]
MFCAGLRETGQREITIYDVDYKAMESVIKFFYTSAIMLTEENIFEVVNVASLLGVSSLHAACITFLRHSITVYNCVSVYTLCHMHGYLDVATEAIKFACANFSRLMELDEFLDMPFKMLQSCLDNKMLNVYSENGLLNRLCTWIKHDLDSRGCHLPVLMDQLDLYNLDLGQAESSLYQLPSLEEQTYKWLDRARHVRERGIVLTSRTRTRYHKQLQVILSCGGLTGGASIANVEALAVPDSTWRCMVPHAGQSHGFRVIPPLKSPRIYAASTYTDEYVYIIGGRGDNGPLNTVERYSVEANEWEEVSSLPEPLEGAAATSCNGSVYVTGGFNNTAGITNKAWVLEQGCKSWRALPTMSHCRSHHGLVAVNGYIYALAGAGSDGTVHANVERLCVHTQHWQRLAPLQFPRSLFSSVVVDNLIFIMGGLDSEDQALRSVQVYDTMSHEWSADTPMSVGRHSHGATVAEGKVYIAAGSDGVHQLATCEVFNTNTHLWHVKPSLARTRVGQAMATITVPVGPSPLM